MQRWLDLGLIFLLVGLTTLLLVVRQTNRSAVGATTVTNSVTELRYTYSDAFDPVSITSKEQENGMLVKLERSEPFAQIAIRIDPLTQLTSGLLKRSVADQLKDHAADLYTQYPDYHKVIEESQVLLNQPTTHLVFTYLATDQATRMHVEIYALEHASKPYFFEFQAKESNVASLKQEFQRFRQSLSFTD